MIGDEHISFTTSKIGSLVDVNQSRDPDGLRCFYSLVQVQSKLQPPPLKIRLFNWFKFCLIIVYNRLSLSELEDPLCEA